MIIAPIEEALAEIKAGRPIIVVDDENRENEGDLTVAAELATPEVINFMARYGRGLICTPLHASIFEQLQIPLMVPSAQNSARHGTNFGVSVGAATGVTTGISAYDRARTIQVIADPHSKPSDLTMPGHVFPLKAQLGGVLQRAGHTEAAVDLARLAGFRPAGVICEILNEDGSMARLPALIEFAKTHQLKITSIEALTEYRRQNESIVVRVEAAQIPTEKGLFQGIAYTDHTGLEHLAMVFGDPGADQVLTRLHSACLTGDVFGSKRCDCGDQLEMAMSAIQKQGSGILLYLAQEGRGIGLTNKIRAYALQEQGLDTVEANRHLGFPDDARTYDVGAAILRDLGVRSIRLMTNNPNKVRELEVCGIKVSERLAHQAPNRTENKGYLDTKAQKMGHWIPR